MTHILPSILVIGTILLGGCETAVPRHGEVVVRERGVDVRVVISDRDRVIIRDWYDDRRKSLPPGLAKQGKLPPGHAKRLGARDTLPPSLAYRPLPAELERRLSRLPDGYARVIVGGDIVLIDSRTRVVLDVLYDVVVD
jgi:hypothetical protein